MKEFSYKTGDYTLYCRLDTCVDGESESITVMMHQGHGSFLTVPAYMEVEGRDIPVTVIGKKAFLGTSGLRQVTLPETLIQLEDWAFAQCEHLAVVIIGRKNAAEVLNKAADWVLFGKGVFDDCAKLEHICIGTEKKDACSALLGAVPYRLNAEYLLWDMDIGSARWYSKWDNQLSAFLDERDDAGYTNVVLCGEEDIQRSKSEFVSDKRRRKCALCLMRLMYDDGLSDSDVAREKFSAYILNHCKGAETEEAWEVLLSDFGDRMEYYNLFAKLGCVTTDNIDAMLLDMGEQHTEAKAYLIDYKQTRLDKDIFSAFVL